MGQVLTTELPGSLGRGNIISLACLQGPASNLVKFGPCLSSHRCLQVQLPPPAPPAQLGSHRAAPAQHCVQCLGLDKFTVPAVPHLGRDRADGGSNWVVWLCLSFPTCRLGPGEQG